jgi:hypothetical protein
VAEVFVLILLFASVVPGVGQMRGVYRVQGPINGCGSQARIQERTYVFKTTDKNQKEISKKIEYDLFISSKTSKNEKSPLIIALHGLNVPPAGILNCLIPGAALYLGVKYQDIWAAVAASARPRSHHRTIHRN